MGAPLAAQFREDALLRKRKDWQQLAGPARRDLLPSSGSLLLAARGKWLPLLPEEGSEHTFPHSASVRVTVWIVLERPCGSLGWGHQAPCLPLQGHWAPNLSAPQLGVPPDSPCPTRCIVYFRWNIFCTVKKLQEENPSNHILKAFNVALEHSAN